MTMIKDFMGSNQMRERASDAVECQLWIKWAIFQCLSYLRE